MTQRLGESVAQRLGELMAQRLGEPVAPQLVHLDLWAAALNGIEKMERKKVFQMFRFVLNCII